MKKVGAGMFTIAFFNERNGKVVLKSKDKTKKEILSAIMGSDFVRYSKKSKKGISYIGVHKMEKLSDSLGENQRAFLEAVDFFAKNFPFNEERIFGVDEIKINQKDLEKKIKDHFSNNHFTKYLSKKEVEFAKMIIKAGIRDIKKAYSVLKYGDRFSYDIHDEQFMVYNGKVYLPDPFMFEEPVF